MSPQQYSILSKRLQIIALGVFAMACLIYTIKSYAHVDTIGPEGVGEVLREQQEARDRESNQGKTPEEFGRSVRDTIDAIERDSRDRSDNNNGRDNSNNNDNSEHHNDRESSREGRGRW